MTTSVPSITSIGHPASGPHLHHLRQTISQLLHRPQITFPGAQPISFSRAHLLALKRRDYFLCEKSDGIRCLLFFTQEPVYTPEGEPTGQTEEAHYLIDRKNNYYRVPGLHFPRWDADRTMGDGGKNDKAVPKWDSFHVDTLVDGELLWDYDRSPNEDGGKDARKAEKEAKSAKGNHGDEGVVRSAQVITDAKGNERRRVLKYLVFDVLALQGAPSLRLTLDKRLGNFHEEILKPYEKLWEHFPADCLVNFAFRMEKKSTQRAYGTEMMFRDILPNLRHGSDGLIFTCRETPYVCGTDENILKWKPAEENSIDFKLDLTFPPMGGRKRKRVGSEDAQQLSGEGAGRLSTEGAELPGSEGDQSQKLGGDDVGKSSGDGSEKPNGVQHEEEVADDDDDNKTPDYDATPHARLLIYAPSHSTNSNHNSNTRTPHNPGDPDLPFGTLHLPPTDWTTMKHYATTQSTGLDGIIIECHRDSLGRWRFNRFRDDKSEANHISVAEKVLESIEDAVTKGELGDLGFAYEVKKAWKAREMEVDMRMRREREERRKKEARDGR